MGQEKVPGDLHEEYLPQVKLKAHQSREHAAVFVQHVLPVGR